MTDEAKDPSRFRQAGQNTEAERSYRQDMQRYFDESAGTSYEKIENFPKYLSRQSLARYLALYDIFCKALTVQGDVVQCGLSWGGSLMYFGLLSAVLEPVNLQRRVIGFDTFEGFPSIHDKDHQVSQLKSAEMRVGGFVADAYSDLCRAVELFDQNRFVGHVNKMVLVKGDACQTIPEFLVANTHTVVSLLHLDFDLYEPTRVALEHFLPRMPKGAVLVFDELNNRTWPGETTAVIEACGLRNLRVQRFPFEPYLSYAVLG
ncbi:TylF/MycF/NovP-related O-methyltransferase [Ferrovum sp.]|jgi:hypothetical protein|uniref:TylF/MycF/NovP-related O-methyltransferase n=1 Tax=Ferrovum sp. TaxID=2609467 RepID=UPI0026072353|nr:TylF/MycF/NovP-related O-methyltransferase [Ferrovum sp.]